MYSSRILENEQMWSGSNAFFGWRTEERFSLYDARACTPRTIFCMVTAALPNFFARNASMRSNASLRRNTLVRPSCNPARAQRDEKSKERKSCDDCGGVVSALHASDSRSWFSLKEFFRSASDKNAVLDDKKLDLLLIVLGRICSRGCYCD